LEEMQTREGKKLAGDVKERLVREYERLHKAEEQRKELAGEREEKVKERVFGGDGEDQAIEKALGQKQTGNPYRGSDR